MNYKKIVKIYRTVMIEEGKEPKVEETVAIIREGLFLSVRDMHRVDPSDPYKEERAALVAAYGEKPSWFVKEDIEGEAAGLPKMFGTLYWYAENPKIKFTAQYVTTYRDAVEVKIPNC